MKEVSILLVEDNPDDVLLIRRAFHKSDLAHALTVLGDGDGAVTHLSDLATQTCPSLILLDLKLPRRSGLEVLEWLRAQAHLKRIPVVVLTSSRRSSDVARAYDLGANSYLVKPVQFEEFREVVKHLSIYWLELNERPEVHSEIYE